MSLAEKDAQWYKVCPECRHGAAHGPNGCDACRVGGGPCQVLPGEQVFCRKCGYNIALHKTLIGSGNVALDIACPDHLPKLQGYPLAPGEIRILPEDVKIIGRASHLLVGANAKQVGAEDYKGGGYGAGAVIQHWDFAASQRFDYFQGQITKYVTRWKQKGGLKDLQKAQHFLEKYIEVHEKFKKENPC